MKLQIKRLITQIFVFVSANLGAIGLKTGFCFPFFYCHACPAATSACPLRAIEKSVYDHSFTWKLFVYPLMILGLVGVTTGRAVCGWACPIGLLQRGAAKVPRYIKKKKPFIKKIGQWKGERYLRYIKYVVLIGLVIVTPFFFMFMFTDICPVGILTGTFPILILNPGKFSPNPFFWSAMIFFVLFFVLIFLVERGWCRYFCPVGAILAPFNKISYLTVSVDEKACVHCNACSDVCPMGINVPEMNRDPECILCGKCINICPKNAIKYERMKI